MDFSFSVPNAGLGSNDSLDFASIDDLLMHQAASVQCLLDGYGKNLCRIAAQHAAAKDLLEADLVRMRFENQRLRARQCTCPDNKATKMPTESRGVRFVPDAQRPTLLDCNRRLTDEFAKFTVLPLPLMPGAVGEDGGNVAKGKDDGSSLKMETECASPASQDMDTAQSAARPANSRPSTRANSRHSTRISCKSDDFTEGHVVESAKSPSNQNIVRTKTGSSFASMDVATGDGRIVKSRRHRAMQQIFGVSEDEGTLSADRDLLKKRVRQSIEDGPSYAVEDFYRKSGLGQRIARSQHFESLSLIIIALNSIWVWIDTDYNDAKVLIEADPVFQAAEHLFCFWFSCEWLVRFAAFQHKRDCLKDRWFTFDTCICLFTVVETWVTTAVVLAMNNTGASEALSDASIFRLVRLFRLTRVARIAKFLRHFPELMILIKGIGAASRSVIYTLSLLVIVIYVFGVAFAQLTAGTSSGAEYFTNVPKSMSTLLLHGCFGEDLPDVVNSIGSDNFGYAALFLLFVLVASLTILNMLMGVLVEVVSNVATAEKATLAAEFVKEQLEQSWAELDDNHDNFISQAEFEMLLDKPKAAKALNDVGVDVVGLVDLADFIFKGSGRLTFAEFMDMVLYLRSSNTATSKDILSLQKFIIQELANVEMRLASPAP